MIYHEIKIETNEDYADIVGAMLTDLGIEAYEIVGGRMPEKGDWDYIDDSLTVTPADEVFVRIFLEDNDAYPPLLKSVKDLLKTLPETFGTLFLVDTLCDDNEWKDKWKSYFKPFKAGESIVVCPLWESYTANAGEIVVKIDPGAAFGSGLHETTKLCIRLLEKLVNPSSHVIDIGCGSGILGIAAAKLGAESVLALDMDDLSVKAAVANSEANGVADRMVVKKSDLLKGAPKIKADVIVANIVADIIIRLNTDVKAFLNPDSTYIMSGIIKERLDDVLASLEENGFGVITVERMGEWCAVAAAPNQS